MARRGRAEEALATLQVQRLLKDWEPTQGRGNRAQFPLQATDIGLNTDKSPQWPKPNFPQIAAATFPSFPSPWGLASFPLSSRVLCDPHQQLSPPTGLLPAFTVPFRSVDEWHRSCGPQRRRDGVKALRGALWSKLVERLGDLLLKNPIVVSPTCVISLKPKQSGGARQITAHRHSEMHRAPVSITNPRGILCKPVQMPAVSIPLTALYTETALDSRSASPALALGGRETSFYVGPSPNIYRTGSATRRRHERQPNNPYTELSRTKFPALSGLLEASARLGRGRQLPGQLRASICANPRQIKRNLQQTPVPLSTRTPQRRPKPAPPLL